MTAVMVWASVKLGSRTGPAVSAPVALVVVDAGHGGPDPGAVGVDGQREKHINLAVADDIARDLRAAGISVVMTRSADQALIHPFSVRADILARAALANASGARLLLSIHTNIESTGRARGPIVYYQAGRRDALALATMLEQQLAMASGILHAPRSAHLLVLSSTRAPAALVELGFLSEPVDAARLSSPIYQRSLALAISRAVLAYLAGTGPG